MGKLHELLAVEGDLRGISEKILNETHGTFTKKADHFSGFIKTLKMFDDNAPESAPERKELVTTVPAKIDYMSDSIIRYLNAVLQKERTNQDAKADIIIDGTTIAKDIPATFLLGLEAKLKAVRKIYEVIPTLQPGIKWEEDSTKDNVYKQAHPEETFKTARVPKSTVAYEATEHHPAQIDRWEETIDTGKWVKENWSGMITPTEKSKLLGRMDKLIQAVKKARQRANTAKVVKCTIGKEIFDFIHS